MYPNCSIIFKLLYYTAPTVIKNTLTEKHTATTVMETTTAAIERPITTALETEGS